MSDCRDDFAWARRQAETARDNVDRLAAEGIDAAHVADELDASGLALHVSAEAMVRMIVVALLALEWSGQPALRGALRRQLVAARDTANAVLARAPSLKPAIDPEEGFLECRRIARAMVEDAAFIHDIMPMNCPYSLEQILDPRFEPASRQGLA